MDDKMVVVVIVVLTRVQYYHGPNVMLTVDSIGTEYIRVACCL